MNFLNDLRYAFRGLRRAPGFALVVILTLALAIGANTTVFTWMDGFVFRPYPAVKDSERLVWLNTRAPNGDEWSVAYPTLQDWGRGAKTVEGIAGYDMVQVNLRVDGSSERAWGSMATGNYFELLGLRPILGRVFGPADEQAAEQVVVLGNNYWKRRFNSDPSVIGKTFTLNGNGFTVIGVLPPRFGGLNVGLVFDLYVPFTVQPLLTPGNQINDRGWQSMEAFARLAPGRTFEQARADLEQVAAEVGRAHDREAEGVLVQHMYERGAAKATLPVLGALLGVTALVLLIACANLANLLLARAGARSKEVAIRLALGARRSTVVRQLLAESGLLAAAGCVLGLGLAWVGRDGLMAFIPPAPFPIEMKLQLNWGVIGFAVAVTAFTTVLFGLAPALRASRPDLVPVLKDEVSGVGVSKSLLRSSLVVTQVALSFVALVCAGLFLRALSRAQEVDIGIAHQDKLLLVSTNAYLAGYTDSTGPVMVEQLLQRIRAMPGVIAAGASTHAPLGFGGNSSQSLTVDGYTPAEGENMSIWYAYVSSGLFETLGTTIVQGRGITDQDQAGSQEVIVVNQAFVDRFYKGQDPVGKRIFRARDTAVIIGVVATGKYMQLDEAARPFVYRALNQSWRPTLEVFVRTTGQPIALTEPLRREFLAFDPSLPFLDPRSMADQTAVGTIVQRIGARMLGIFGGLALLLSAIGIYGVMAYTVSLRTREMGIRLALGAARERVVRMVLFYGGRLALIGLVLGGALGFAVANLMRSLLFGVPAGDPATFVAIALLLVTVALVASAIPAIRAARIDPIRALKSE
jgi:predicted permease